MKNTTYRIAIELKGHEEDYRNGKLESEFSWEEFDTVEEAQESLRGWLRDIDHNDGGCFGELDGEYIGYVLQEMGRGCDEPITVYELDESEALKGTGMHLYAAISPDFIGEVAYCKAKTHKEAAEKIASNWEEADDFFEYIANSCGDISQVNNGEEFGYFCVEEV